MHLEWSQIKELSSIVAGCRIENPPLQGERHVNEQPLSLHAGGCIKNPAL